MALALVTPPVRRRRRSARRVREYAPRHLAPVPTPRAETDLPQRVRGTTVPLHLVPAPSPRTTGDVAVLHRVLAGLQSLPEAS